MKRDGKYARLHGSAINVIGGIAQSGMPWLLDFTPPHPIVETMLFSSNAYHSERSIRLISQRNCTLLLPRRVSVYNYRASKSV